MAEQQEKKKARKVTNPAGGSPPAKYRFAKGVSGNPAGRPQQGVYARVLTDRMMRSCPPRSLSTAELK